MSTKTEELAEQGEAEAQCALALLFELGLDRPADREQALYWWKKAAAQKHPSALAKLQSYGQDSSEVVSDVKGSAHTATNTTKHGLKAKILVVEDDTDVRNMMVESLSPHFQVIEARDGQTALSSILSNPDIEVLVTDLRLPKMNGIQLVKTIRKMKVLEEAAIIVVSGYLKPEYIKSGQRLNVHGWLAKPFSMQKLFDLIETTTGKGVRVA